MSTHGEPPLGCNLYLWERLEQNRFLVEHLRPLASELEEAGLVDLAWYDRFDARGPHVFFLLRCAPEDLEEVESRLRSRLDVFIAEGEPSDLHDEESLAELHEGCRGKVQWGVDLREGLGSDRTYLIERHPAGGYPFAFWRDFEPAAAAALSRAVGASSRWALEHVPVGRDANMKAGVSWCAHFDLCLRRQTSPEVAADYWRHHAGTLIMGLGERWENEADEVKASLPGLVKARTAEGFEGVFRGVEEASEPVWPPMDDLVSTALAGAPAEEAAWRALREIHHITLKQLGLFVRFHMPIVVFSWNRNLQQSED